LEHQVHATYEIKIDDVVYLQHASGPLLARLYLPQGSGPFPLVAEVHGGAWCRGGRLDEDGLNQSLARRGIAVAALDFRMPPHAAYPASLMDINYGVRWLKTHASLLKSRPELVSLMGTSSGGHQAILAAMRPDDPRYAALSLPPVSADVDASVARVVMCWPVIDPLGRYRYALELQSGGKPYPAGIDRVVPDHEKFWGNEEAMSEGSPVRILERGDKVATPPALCLQGDSDLMHPRAHLERFIAAYKRTGGALVMRWFAGEAEGFITKKPDSASTAEAIEEIVRFLSAENGEDTISL